MTFLFSFRYLLLLLVAGLLLLNSTIGTPCALCRWQQAPYYILVGILLLPSSRLKEGLIYGALLFSVAVSVYHLLVLYGLIEWRCAVSTKAATTLQELKTLLDSPRPCHRPPKLLGLSLPFWNCLVATLLGGLWFYKRR